MKNKFNILLLTFSLLVVVNGYSQKAPPKPPPSGKPAAPPSNPGLPIDGGLSYLLVSGILFGVYELRKRRKN